MSSTRAVILILVVGFSGCAPTERYADNKDMKERFGDGRFQVHDAGEQLVVVDMSAIGGKSLLQDVTAWSYDGVLIFATNKHGEFVIINSVSGEHRVYQSIDLVPGQYRATCSRLAK